MKGIYTILSHIWKKTFLLWYRLHIVNRKYAENNSKCSYGNANRGKKFYIINKNEPYSGLACFIMNILGSIDYAERKGYIPIVDMQTMPNIYLLEEEIGIKNAWEYFFKQPCDYGLNDILDSKCVIRENATFAGTCARLPSKSVAFLLGKEGDITYWRNLTKKYIRLNSKIEDSINEEYNRLFLTSDRVIGAICRGTDYTYLRPIGHAVQPTTEEMIEKIKEMMHTNNCNKIFLATEDKTIFETMKSQLGDALCTNRKSFIEYTGGLLGKSELNHRENTPYQEGMCYMTTLGLLSKCHCLCAGVSGATTVSLLFNDQYEDVYLFDLGQYSETDIDEIIANDK